MRYSRSFKTVITISIVVPPPFLCSSYFLIFFSFISISPFSCLFLVSAHVFRNYIVRDFFHTVYVGCVVHATVPIPFFPFKVF